MALTMVHLLVADLWARSHPEYLENPEYYYGAVSPDAMHIRFHGDKSRKDEFHLYNWRALHREPVVAQHSQATWASGSWASMASSTASEIWSQILSGCPSVTDSDVKKCLIFYALRGCIHNKSSPNGELVRFVSIPPHLSAAD